MLEKLFPRVAANEYHGAPLLFIPLALFMLVLALRKRSA